MAEFKRSGQGAVLQDGIPRYSRLAVCVTRGAEALTTYESGGQDAAGTGRRFRFNSGAATVKKHLVLPIRDNIPSRRFPAATLAIIAVNTLIFLWELQLGPRRLEIALWELAVVPLRYSDSDAARYFSTNDLLPFFSSMFLHGGWLHLIGNMWTLWIFGDNVEDRLGRGRYVALYLASGVAAALMHIYTNLGSQVPTIGASGAIAGVMGAYFRFFPHARVETVIPPFIFGPYFVLPAVVFLGWWFLLQFFNGALSLGAGARGFGGIAWWAHVGGFTFGVAVCLFARRPRLVYYDDEHA